MEHPTDNLTNASGVFQGDNRKLFVGGISPQTTEQQLQEHFGRFGEIRNINVKFDVQTGKSRGFAFIAFNNPEAIDQVFTIKHHIINNKKVDPKRANIKPSKIFVGGITNRMSEDEIKNCFGQYGNIIQTEFPFDKIKNQRKGFCFITYDSEDVVNGLLKISKVSIGGRDVEIKKAARKTIGVPIPIPENGNFGGYPNWSEPARNEFMLQTHAHTYAQAYAEQYLNGYTYAYPPQNSGFDLMPPVQANVTRGKEPNNSFGIHDQRFLPY